MAAFHCKGIKKIIKYKTKMPKYFLYSQKSGNFAAILRNKAVKMKKIKRINAKIYLWGAVAVALLIAGCSWYCLFSSLSKSEQTEYVYIDMDDDLDSVMTKIQPLAKPFQLSALSTLSPHGGYAGNIRTGRYAIRPGEGALKVFRHLKNGLQSSINLTIPEVRTIDRLAGALSRKLMLDSAEVARHLTDSAYCARWGYNTATIPALFIPNTYDIYWNVSLDKFMERMQKEHKTFWNFGRMEKAKSMGMSPVEVATMASIIDEETANNGEKPMIAGMYYNRLKTGMPLQADPTVKFALKDFALRRIYNKLLQTDSPYNTYKNTGLPPGPIKIASIAGIDAVLNHVRHDYLYMCAKEDFSGTHNFAKTYQEHLNNAARYTKALNQRGIK